MATRRQEHFAQLKNTVKTGAPRVRKDAYTEQRAYCRRAFRFNTYEVCPESIQTFWISRVPVPWPWCNLTASQRRPYWSSMNRLLSRGASQSAVRCRWLSLCTVWPSHLQWPSEQISFVTTMRLSILQLSRRPFWQNIASPRSVRPPPPSPDLAPYDFWLFPKLKSPFKKRRFVNAKVTQYTSSVNGVSLPTD
jgi:hypothetical protein